MALVVTDSQNYEDIADAINQKLGTSNKYYPSEMADAILSISGGGSGDIDPYSTFVQMNPLASEFLENTLYEDLGYADPNAKSKSAMQGYDAFTYEDIYYPTFSGYRQNAINISPELVDPSEGTYRADEPIVKSVSFADAGNLTIIDGENHEHTSTTPIPSGNYDLYNLTPDELAYYINEVNNKIVQAGSLKGTGQIRMIHTTTTMGTVVSHNVRDLGGWACDGGTIKYGKVFRGVRFNGGSVSISATDINTFHNLLGIRDEIDLRNDGDGISGITGSAFGSDVEWHNYKLVDYTNSLTQNASDYKDMFEQIAYDVSHNIPIYIHCAAGCDRTGVVCGMLEAILGVERYNIDKDYELSSLVNMRYHSGTYAGWVYGTVPNQSGSVRYRNDSRWINFWNAIFNNSTGSIRDAVVSYLISIGVSIDTINTIRNNVIDGNPQDLTVPTYSVSYTLPNASSTNTDTSVDIYGDYGTTINVNTGYNLNSITVTMSGIDITSDAVIDNNIFINQVTGDIAIVVSTSAVSYSISRALTNAFIDNTDNTINYGELYMAKITPISGYMILNRNIIVTMGGINILISGAGTITDGTGSDSGKKIIMIPSVSGNISINCTAQPIQRAYFVDTNLINATSSYTDNQIYENSAFEAVITPNTYYIFDSANNITVTMGGLGTITKSYNPDNHAITINSEAVTGNIIIRGMAKSDFWSVITNIDDNIEYIVTGDTDLIKVIKGGEYHIEMTPYNGYNFSTTPTVTMGGISQTVTEGTGENTGKMYFNTTNASGDIVITASAEKVDIVSNNFFFDGKQYDALGCVWDWRLTSTGSYSQSSATGAVVLGMLQGSAASGGYIPIDTGTVLKIAKSSVGSLTSTDVKHSIGYYVEDTPPSLTPAFLYENTEDSEGIRVPITNQTTDGTTFRLYEHTLSGVYSLTDADDTYYELSITRDYYVTGPNPNSKVFYFNGYPTTGASAGTWIAGSKYIRISLPYYDTTTKPEIYLYDSWEV